MPTPEPRSEYGSIVAPSSVGGGAFFSGFFFVFFSGFGGSAYGSIGCAYATPTDKQRKITANRFMTGPRRAR
jgi:hypothetical protein